VEPKEYWQGYDLSLDREAVLGQFYAQWGYNPDHVLACNDEWLVGPLHVADARCAELQLTRQGRAWERSTTKRA